MKTFSKAEKVLQECKEKWKMSILHMHVTKIGDVRDRTKKPYKGKWWNEGMEITNEQGKGEEGISGKEAKLWKGKKAHED